MPLAAAVDDRAFLTDGRPYLNARQAATYVGFEPTPGVLARDDKQMKLFYQWTYARGIHAQPGRAVYLRAELDAAIRRGPLTTRPRTTGDELEAMRRLARDDVADRRRRARLELRRTDNVDD